MRQRCISLTKSAITARGLHWNQSRDSKALWIQWIHGLMRLTSIEMPVTHVTFSSDILSCLAGSRVSTIVRYLCGALRDFQCNKSGQRSIRLATVFSKLHLPVLKGRVQTSASLCAPPEWPFQQISRKFTTSIRHAPKAVGCAESCSEVQSRMQCNYMRWQRLHTDGIGMFML